MPQGTMGTFIHKYVITLFYLLRHYMENGLVGSKKETGRSLEECSCQLPGLEWNCCTKLTVCLAKAPKRQ